MNKLRSCSVIITFIAFTSFIGCSGSDGGGGGPLISITVAGTATPPFAAGAAAATCPAGAFVNTRVTLRFAAAVDPATLPADGLATGGSIVIVDASSGDAASGTWTIDAGAPGTVHFDADSPAGANPCGGGLRSAGTYLVTVAAAGTPGGAVSVGGIPIAMPITACFTVVACDPGNPGPALFDRVAGPPVVIATTPAADATAPTTTVTAIADPAGPGSLVTLDFNQNIDASSVSTASVLIANTSANAGRPIPVAVNVSLMQGLGAMPTRVTLTTAQPLADGDLHEISLIGVRDFEGLSLTTTPGELVFALTDENDDQPCTFLDDFTTTANRESTTGSIAWNGDGAVSGTAPVSIIGNGLDGAINIAVPLTINTDSLLTPGDPSARPGTLNATNLAILADLTVTSTTDVSPGQSNWPLQLLAIGSISLGAPGTPVSILAAGRVGQNSLQIPAVGNSRRGGWGGPGGGRGGTASPNLIGISSSGDDGEGGHVDASDPARPGGTSNLDPASPLFGGGGGGEAGQAASFSDGPGGGGGGSASSFAGYGPGDPPLFQFNMPTAGEPHTGSDGLGAGAPLAGVPGPFPPAMIPPLTEPVGGSGGGAGGDRVVNPSMPSTSNPGAAGGGGGGGVGLGAGAGITVHDGCTLDCSGGDGGLPVGFFIGGGAGGSGGSIFVRTLGQLTFGLGVILSTRGGEGNDGIPAAGSLNGEAGRGGDGVIHLEDSQLAFVPTLPPKATFVMGELFTQLLSASGVTTGLATSVVIDTGATPDFMQASAAQVAATVPGTASLRLIGIAESPDAPGTPATAMMDAAGRLLMIGPVDLADVDMLDGMRFLRFVIDTDYVVPQVFGGTEVYPGVTSVSIDFVK